MASDKSKTPKPMCVHDVDEGTGRPIRESKRSASTKLKEKEKDPERPKIAHRDSVRRSKNPSSDSGYSTGQVPGGSEASSPEVQRVEVSAMPAPTRKHERRNSVIEKSPRKHERASSRPPPDARSPQKMVVARENPLHYGVTRGASIRTTPPVVSQPSRSHSSTSGRPASSYGTSPWQAPPISNQVFWQQQQQQQAAYAGHPFPSASPSPVSYAAPHPAPTPQTDYFTQPRQRSNSLARRFDPPTRTASAYSVREQQVPNPAALKAYHDDRYHAAVIPTSTGQAIGRTGGASIRVPSRMGRLERTYRYDDDESEREYRAEQMQAERERQRVRDYEGMPPPPLPQSTRPGILHRPNTDGAYIESGKQLYQARRLVTSDRLQGRPDRYYDCDDEPVGHLSVRPNVKRNSAPYDLSGELEHMHLEPAHRGRDRHSYYEQASSAGSYGRSTTSSDVERKVRAAETHQAHIGNATVPLTADMLRRQQRHAGSTRSTKSSGSRDESDYIKSATTRTTRSVSSPEDENVTINVKGQARVIVGGAQIDCQEGGEIQIQRRDNVRTNAIGSSERSEVESHSHARIEDKRSRSDRPSGRSRMSSRHDYPRTRISEGSGGFF